MAAFLSSTLYQQLPGIALALDEGLASPSSDTYSVFYGERLPWWIDVTATGVTGHGSRFMEPNAVSQLIALTQNALEFRSGQRALLDLDVPHERCTHAVARKHVLGDVTTLNITRLESGVRVGPQNDLVYNVVPPTAHCSMDIRIAPHMAPAAMRDLLNTWCQECSAQPPHAQVTWSFAHGHGNDDAVDHAVTSIDPISNPWYAVFAQALTHMKYRVDAQVFPAATDSRFLRALGIRALGFSPMRNTEILLHENDEYIPIPVYWEGIDVYIGLLRALGNALPDEKEGAGASASTTAAASESESMA
jgi:aminoacylase